MKQNAVTLIVLLLSMATDAYSQQKKNKNYFPIWTFHQDSINIHGISIGLGPLPKHSRNTNTNGIKAELLGIGFLIPLIPRSPIVESDSALKKLESEPLSEKINGLNVSTTGSICHCLTNGLAVGGIGQIQFQVNGISAAIEMNFIQKQNGLMSALVFNSSYHMNGLQIAFLSNSAFQMNGLQIGLLNGSKKLYGIQIGLWNVNQKRELPFINWSF